MSPICERWLCRRLRLRTYAEVYLSIVRLLSPMRMLSEGYLAFVDISYPFPVTSCPRSRCYIRLPLYLYISSAMDIWWARRPSGPPTRGKNVSFSRVFCDRSFTCLISLLEGHSFMDRRLSRGVLVFSRDLMVSLIGSIPSSHCHATPYQYTIRQM